MPNTSKRKSNPSRSALVFEKQNYLLLGTSVFLIAGGFVAMYLEGEFLGTISLTVSPIVIMCGYALLIVAILWRPDGESDPSEAES